VFRHSIFTPIVSDGIKIYAVI